MVSHLTKIVLLHILFGSCHVVCDNESEGFILDPSASFMTEYIITESLVRHIETDKYIDGNILFTDGSSLKTTDGNKTQLIAGQAIEDGYLEGVGEAALFYHISGFYQINSSRAIVIDRYNYCLRLVDRLSRQTETWAGNCTEPGYRDGFEALFYWPDSMIADNQDKNKLLISDPGNNALRHIDLTTRVSYTFFNYTQLIKLYGIAQDTNSGHLYLTSDRAIYQLSYDDMALTLLAGSQYGFKDGDFPSAKFKDPEALLFLENNEKILVADFSNDRLRILDTGNNVTTTLCTVFKGYVGYVYVETEICLLNNPFSLMATGDSLYVGERGRILQLSGKNDEISSVTDNSSMSEIISKTNLWNGSVGFRVAMMLLITAVVTVFVVSLICFLRRRRRSGKQLMAEKQRKRQQSEVSGNLYNVGGRSGTALEPFHGKKLDENLQAQLSTCLISKESLTLDRRIGRGNFGTVYKAQLITPSGTIRTVAVKTLKDEKQMAFEDLENFLTEGMLMLDFQHKNVMTLIGVVYENGGRPQVVLPYMDNGDLCTLIRKEDVDLVFGDLLHFGYQIANGMEYLAKKRFVHRDLAARNCMVDASYIVKVADFGLSKDVYERDYYTTEDTAKPLPIKWMAIESLKQGRYSSQSDIGGDNLVSHHIQSIHCSYVIITRTLGRVLYNAGALEKWSYGVTMWELLTHGASPYPGVDNCHIKNYVSSGNRLDKPEISPSIIFEMMCRCWQENPVDRPSFYEISRFLEAELIGHKSAPNSLGEGNCYAYPRRVTKCIPSNYMINDPSDGYVEFIDTVPSPHREQRPPSPNMIKTETAWEMVSLEDDTSSSLPVDYAYTTTAEVSV